jgi:glycine/D-amino acid oxidase-like deaminating enzyme
VIGVRVVVVGAGVVGLLTAVECVRAGARVDVVDRDVPPSRWAASYDRMRVVRALHPDDAGLTRAAVRAHHAWTALERRLGPRFYHRIGAVTALPAAQVPAGLTALAEAGATAWAVYPDELPAAYPRVRFAAGRAAIAETMAGVVRSDRVLTALVGWLRRQPLARLHPRRRVTAVGPGAAILDGGGTLTGDRVVVAAGPWSRELLPDAAAAGLMLFRQSVLSYAAVPSRQAWVGTPAIPALGTREGAWMMPPVGAGPARLSAAAACRPVHQMTDRATPVEWRERLVDHFRTRLTGFDPAAVVGADDGYYLADAATGRPVLVGLDADETVWAYAACGGMSFKFAPLIAAGLADRALGRPPRHTGLQWMDRPRRVAAAGRGEPR